MSWWTRMFGRTRFERELDAELQDHLERHVADLVASGVDEAEARRRASASLGGIEPVKEYCRDTRGTAWLDRLAQDLRYGIRVLRNSPGFTAMAVLSLALGIGANTAIFSIVDTLLLRTLPVREPHRLALLDRGSFTNPIWEEIKTRQRLFGGAFAWSSDRFDLARGGQADYASGLWASGELFDVLGVRPVLGRMLTPADDQRGGGPDGPAAVISYAFWQSHFGGSPDAVGKPLLLNRVPFTVVGVAPPEFFGPVIGDRFEVAVPIRTADLLTHGRDSLLTGRSTWWLNVMVRLAPGQSLEAATQALRGVQPQIRDATVPPAWRVEDRAHYLREPLTLVPAAQGMPALRDRYRQPLLAIMTVVGIVLLIACANIGSLLLARASSRRHELAMRRALGASSFRIGRQLLTESLLLSVVGAILGLLFGQWGSRLLVSQLSTPENAIFLDLSLDWRVLGFTAVVAVGTALLFGIVPALAAGRVAPSEALSEQGRTTAGTTRRSSTQLLVFVQVALSLVLVFAAGLFVRTFTRLATLDPGFDRSATMVITLDAQRTGVERVDLPQLFQRVSSAAAATPGVARAAASMIAPVSGMVWNDLFDTPGAPPRQEREREAYVNAVSPGWFATYDTALRVGRDFDARDRTGATGVAIVNETFARRWFGNGQAIGRTVQPQPRPNSQAQTFEIVGVVEDAVYRSLREPVPPTVYLPLAQLAVDDTWPFANVTVLSAGPPPATLVRALAANIGRVDPNLTISFRPLAEQVGASLARERAVALLSAFFGVLALLLAAIGLYGVTAYTVSRRRTEIGVRLALGANGSGVIRLVLTQAATPIVLGLVTGAIISAWASRLVGPLLFGLAPGDPVTLAGAALVLAATGSLAAWLPARRAARIDPAQVLRDA